MPADQQQPDRQTLAQYLEAKHKPLTELGVFSALAVYATNLPLHALGEMLSFAFLTLAVLIWIELFPDLRQRTELNLRIFQLFMVGAVALIVFYWLLNLADAYDGLANLLTAIVACTVWLAVMEKTGILRWAYSSGTARQRLARSLFLAALALGLLVGWLLFMREPVAHWLSASATHLAGS